MTVRVVVEGLRLGRGLNDRKHWSRAHADRERERRAVWMVLHKTFAPLRMGQKGTAEERLRAAAGDAPWKVSITRRSPSAKGLDSDNLAGACKAVQDELAHWLGVDDGDASKVTWARLNARGPWAVLVAIEGVGLMDGEGMMPIEDQ